MQEGPIVDAVCKLIRQRLPHASPEKIRADSLIGAAGLGLDSIDQVELIADLEAHFGIELPTEVVSREDSTVASVAAAIEARQQVQ